MSSETPGASRRGPGQLARFATSGGGGPNGIAIGDDGNVYVADTWNHRIQVFSPDGAYLNGWGSFFDAQDDPVQAAANGGQFYGPRGLAFHNGELYVTDTGNKRVLVFDAQGNPLRQFGGLGSGPANLNEPVGIAIDRYGPKNTMLATSALAVAGIVLFALAPSATTLILSRGLMGLGCSTFFMAPLVIYARRFPPTRFAALTAMRRSSVAT